MKKIFKCFIVALIFSIAYAAMPSFVEAVEVSDKFKGDMENFERFLSQADEKKLEEFSNAVLKSSTRDLTIAQAVGTVKFALGVMERKFEAEKNSLSETERQKRLDQIESTKFVLWTFEAVEQRKAELAEAKQQRLNAQKNSANKPEEKSFLDKALDFLDDANDVYEVVSTVAGADYDKYEEDSSRSCIGQISNVILKLVWYLLIFAVIVWVLSIFLY